MNRRQAALRLLLFGLARSLGAQETVYVCPMDPDMRSNSPGVCSRCGMKLVSGVPEPLEYPMDLSIEPAAPKPGEPVHLEFTVRDPHNHRVVTHFQLVHEKLFHLFAVSADLDFFLHDHPVLGPDGVFRFTTSLPRPGLYRFLGDFYPDGATPQLISKSVIVPGAPAMQTAHLTRDLAAKDAGNMKVSVKTDPPEPIAGTKTMMFFHVEPGAGLEKYIGAWGHMLAVSEDLIDQIHTHPFIADGGPDLQFNVYFPRARNYRVWVQFQRNGVVNTAHFDVPVAELK
jgi:hypothetical protein